MKRLVLIACLLTGCGQTPTTAPVEAAAPAVEAAPPVEAAPREAGPRPGVWALTYHIVGNEQVEELPIRFLPSGQVEVSGMPAIPSDFPNQWDAERVTFEGRVRQDFLNRSAVSRDRLALDVESPTTMRGTLSLRVNFRWIALPVNARFVRSLKAGLAVTPGTIVDPSEAERFN